MCAAIVILKDDGKVDLREDAITMGGSVG